MASAKIFDMTGAEQGAVDLPAGVFDAAPNDALVHDVAVALQAAKRQGNASTKTRGQVRGGGRKPFRQKGTGNARQGSNREPQMKGGGTVFGPHRRSYRQRTPVRFKRRALCCVLSARAQAEQVLVVDGLRCESPKTKPFAAFLEALPLARKRTLIVTAGPDKGVCLSARNIQRVAVQTASDLNALDVLASARVIVSREALAKLEERLS